jgi:dienelactone hydrolase
VDDSTGDARAVDNGVAVRSTLELREDPAMGTSPQSLAGYERDTFTHLGKERAIYRIGSGPAVIVIAEMPGITPRVLEFGRRVASIGCTSVLPHLFGEPGRDGLMDGNKLSAAGYTLTSIAPACISRDFAAFATRKTSPVVDWLRALGRHEHERCGGPGIGAIGMCFTGGFALAMATDASMLAPVLSQPSLPFGFSKGHRHSIDCSRADLAKVRDRCENEGLRVLGLRFSGDALVPADRFAFLREELGDGFVAVEIDSSKGNPAGIPRVAHSVVTEHFVDEPGHPTRDALDQVLELFRRRLLAATP